MQGTRERYKHIVGREQKFIQILPNISHMTKLILPIEDY